MNKFYVTLLAGGIGKRMNSCVPKVLHLVNGKPMIVKLIKKVIKLNPHKIIIVVGKYHSQIKEEIDLYVPENNLITYVIQEKPLGTADAVKSTLHIFNEYEIITNLILNGDIPLIHSSTLKEIYHHYLNINSKIMVTAINLDNPFGNGRIIFKDNIFEQIIEEKDCCEEEKKVTLVNCGIYLCNSNILRKFIPKIKNNNAQNEYYLPDLIKIYKNETNKNIDLYVLSKEKQMEIFNINTPEQLMYANCACQVKIN